MGNEVNLKDAARELGFEAQGVGSRSHPWPDDSRAQPRRDDGGRAMSRNRQGLGGRRTRRLNRLLDVLAVSPGAYKRVDVLTKATGLRNTVYPLLADLSRRGWVEHRWLETLQGPCLAYRLFAEGRHRGGVGTASGSVSSLYKS